MRKSLGFSHRSKQQCETESTNHHHQKSNNWPFRREDALLAWIGRGIFLHDKSFPSLDRCFINHVEQEGEARVPLCALKESIPVPQPECQMMVFLHNPPRDGALGFNEQDVALQVYSNEKCRYQEPPNTAWRERVGRAKTVAKSVA
jgi:hypothetical protein